MVSQSKIVQVVRQALLNAADELLSHEQETSAPSFDQRSKNSNARKRSSTSSSSSSSSMKKNKKKTIRKKKTSC